MGLTDDQSEVARILDESGGGLNVDPDDVERMKNAFLKLKQNRDECRELGRNARRYIEDYYSRDAVLRKYEQIMMELSQNANRPR
jgi:glycosyltransferase involved in cell wall biosynthesis